MGFVLSKIIPALFFPVSLTCILCLVTCVLALRRRAKSAALLAFIAAVLLYLASTHPLSWILMRGLESQYSEAESYPKVPAIVLLGGSMIPFVAPQRHPEIGPNGDRVLQAARLWKKSLASKLVVTGGAIPLLNGYKGAEAPLYADLFSELFDVPDSSILQVPTSQNTYEDAVYTKNLFDSLGMKKEIILVTSATHMPRSVLLFRKQGFIVHPAPGNFRVSARFGFKPFCLIPNEEYLEKTATALHEYLGLAAYYVMGRL